jgi:hypothetical protein
MKTVKFATLLVAATLAIPALAQSDRIDRREANQQRRIEQGQKSGALTDKEAARLEKDQARIEKKEQKARADGKMTARERARLEKAQNRESKKIYREKHDKQTAK